jgi:4-hydroxybenzoate polyprenyltransferase
VKVRQPRPPVESPAPLPPAVPLAVDLDGTLIRTDLLWESFVAVLRQRPWVLLRAPCWWARGRACLKQELGRRAALDPALLPVHEDFLAWLRTEKARGRKLILATASDAEFATPVGKHFGLFDEILGSDGRQNLRGANKGRVLAARFGERGFDYAGNSSVDLAVWPFARAAVVVNARPSLPARAEKVAQAGPVFPRPRAELPALLAALCPTGWFACLLVLAPLLLLPPGSGLVQPAALGLTLAAFLLADSAMSLLRALLDLDADRRDATRRHGSLAAGDAPLSRALALIPLLVLGTLALSTLAAPALGALLSAVLALEAVRLWWLRRWLVPDVVAQAWLAMTRVAAGTLAVGGTLAGGFAGFLALAFAAVAAAERHRPEDAARSWRLAHGCGLVAGPVLGWFAGTPEAALAFQRPGWLLLLWPALLLWIIRALKTASTPAQPARDAFRWTLALVAAAVVWLAVHG